MASIKSLQIRLGAYGDPATVKTVNVRLEKSLTVECIVLDVRECWNRIDLLVTPVSGTGEQWVSDERITNIENGDAS
jgi:hypothetical protein